MKLVKHITGQFGGADRESIERLDKIRIGEVIEVAPVRRDVKQHRSTKLNAYYWSVVLAMLLETFDSVTTKEGMHEILKQLYFGADVVEVEGIIAQHSKGSTRGMSTSEFQEYLKTARHIGDMRGIYIPEPNQCGY